MGKSMAYLSLKNVTKEYHSGEVTIKALSGVNLENVRPLKRYASWVQNVVRQFGPYPAWAQDI